MLNEDYKDMLQSLQAEGVKFMLVGGYAMAAHGHPRSTLDIDFWVMASPENAKAIMRALKRFGAPLRNVCESDFKTEGTILQIGVVPRRIDIITKIDGVSFVDAWPRAVPVELDGCHISVISLEDLLANKSASGRLKDLADVATLEHMMGLVSAKKPSKHSAAKTDRTMRRENTEPASGR